MSRSRHQSHKETRNSKCPRTFLLDTKNNRIIRRHRKTKPYGRLNFSHYGKEAYSRSLKIEYFPTRRNKRKERTEAKKDIRKKIEHFTEKF